MDICNMSRYGKELRTQLSKLEKMHDDFREQKEFCFTQMFREFGIECGQTIEVDIPLILPTDGANITYNVFAITWGADEYVYIKTRDNHGNEVMFEPYYLDAYNDFEYVFSLVYDYLSKKEEEKKPTNEFAMATYNYLTEECKFANKNNVDLGTLATQLRGHNITEDMFDVNIGAFCFTIRNTDGYGYSISDNFEVWENNGNVHQTTIQAIKCRLDKKN